MITQNVFLKHNLFDFLSSLMNTTIIGHIDQMILTARWLVLIYSCKTENDWLSKTVRDKYLINFGGENIKKGE